MNEKQESKVYTIVRKTWLSQKPRASSLLVTSLVTFLLAFASLMASQNWWSSETWMIASKQTTLIEHHWWQLWTSLFVHADGRHLLSNSILFFILGFFLYGYFGFFLFPFSALLVVGLTNWIVLSKMKMPETQLIGMSGVVFWMGGAWLVLYGLLDRRRSLFQRFLRVMGVTLLLFVPSEAFDPSTSYESHFVGFLLGLLSGLVYFFFRRFSLRAKEVKELIVEDADEFLASGDA